jgi:beta-glucanase (GH16 family)
MKIKLLLLWSLFFTLGHTHPSNNFLNNYKLVFNDEFNGKFLDNTKWNIENGIRYKAINSPQSIIVKDGFLHIHPFTRRGIHHTAIITTEDKFSFNKGYVEIRVKFGDVSGTWSDAWLWAESAGSDEAIPLNDGAEIDIWEHRKFDSNKKDISGYVNHVLHWNGYGKRHQCLATDTGDLKLDKDFHVFGLLWDESGYTFSVDGRTTSKFTGPRTDKKLFLLLSTEIANIEFWTQPPPEYIDTDTLIVDYVRIYQKF